MRINGPARALFEGLRVALPRAGRTGQQTLRVAGLRGPVDVVTDSWGVPHIHAGDVHDLFFAQGYVTARDRLFQLDYNRHGARGRLCELVGRRPIPWRSLTVHLKERTTLDVDIMLRTFGLEKAARESLELLSDRAREVLDAYTAGVNAYLATGPWTLEHAILGRKAPAWTALDSMVMFKAIGFELNYAWRAILLGAMLADGNLPEEVASAFGPCFAQGGPPIVDAEAYRAAAGLLAADRDAADVALGVGGRPGVGSNSVVVSGALTATPGALLANDTHLNLTCPLPWHEVHLSAGDLELHGFALAGTPGIGIGRTGHFAWGITAGLVHDLDLFVERLDPDDPEIHLTPDGWQPLATREEVFHIRGEGYVERKIYSSRHGPLLETVNASLPADQRLAVQWTGHQPAAEPDLLWEIWNATSPEQVRRALRHHVCPTYNISYAGEDGRIGYFLAGRIPKRRAGTPLRFLEGWTGEWDWDGTVAPEDNPMELDPERGFIVTANNRVGPWDYPHELGQLFEPPDRFNRLTDRIRAQGWPVTLEDLAALQLDTHAPWCLACRDLLIDLAGGVDSLAPEVQSLARIAAELWRDWDGDAAADSAGAAVAYVAAHFAGEQVVRQLVGEDAARAYLEMSSLSGPSVLRLGELAEPLRRVGVDVRGAVRQAFVRAVEHCARSMGDDPMLWRWGSVHRLVARHRFDASPLGCFFSLGPEPTGGGPDTVNRADFNAANGFDVQVGPAMRLVVEAGAPAAQTILPGGQSGSRLSAHYDDQLAAFLAGDLKTVKLGHLDEPAERRETFEPKKTLGREVTHP